MADVKSYVPGQTGTLSDVIERGPELQPITPAGPDGFAADPSWSQMFQSARPAALRSTPLYDDVKTTQGWAPIIDALGLPASENPGYFGDLDPAGEARFGSAGSPSQLATDAQVGESLPFSNGRLADRSLQESLVIQQIQARRAKQPNFLPGFVGTSAGVQQYLEQQQAAKRAAGASVLARGTAFGRVTASLAAGGVESAANDPTFLPSMIFGGGTAETLLQAVGRDALINGVLTAANQPVLAHNMAENGEHLTLGEGLVNVAEGAGIGAAFGGTIHLGATHIPPALFQVMPESVQTRWADRMRVGDGKDAPLLKDVVGDMDNRELAAFARSTIGPHMTPDESAAANVLERAQEVGETSPFMPGPVGDGAHNASIAAGLKTILDGAPEPAPTTGALLSSTSLTPSPSILGRPVSTAEARVPGDIVQFFKGKGLDDAHAYGIAAGIVAESGGREAAVNSQSGAFGLGQLLGSRKAALFDRYGPNPSRTEQLEHLWGELTGGDPGGKFVLGAKDAGSVLNAYVRNFMRPRAGAETAGDLERGMAALGHKGELPSDTGAVGATGGDDDLVAAAALQRDAEQADQATAAQGDRSAEPAAPQALAEAGLSSADMPILRRDLFGSDADWAEAQLAFGESLRGENAPEMPGNAPAIETASRPPEVATAAAGAPSAPGARPQSLREWFGGSLVADEAGRPLTVYHGSGSEFDTFDVARAGEGRGTAGEQALFFSTDPDVASHSAMVAGAGHATGEPTHTGQFSDNGGVVYPVHLRVENPLMSKLRHYGSEDFAKEIARARAGGHDGVIFPHVTSRGENGTIAVFHPDQVRSIFADAANVRIDDPELKTFDDGGDGRAQLADSLEHDYRAAAKDPELGKRAYLLGDSDKPRTLLDIIDDLDRDAAAAKALRACAAGGAA